MRPACCNCLRMSHLALLLLPLSFFLGVGAPSLSLSGFMFKAARRGSLFVVFVQLLHRCGLCFGFIGTNTVPSAELRPLRLLRRCVCWRVRRYSCCATLIMIWLS